jgi:hypothetical protein
MATQRVGVRNEIVAESPRTRDGSRRARWLGSTRRTCASCRRWTARPARSRRAAPSPRGPRSARAPRAAALRTCRRGRVAGCRGRRCAAAARRSRRGSRGVDRASVRGSLASRDESSTSSSVPTFQTATCLLRAAARMGPRSTAPPREVGRRGVDGGEDRGSLLRLLLRGELAERRDGESTWPRRARAWLAGPGRSSRRPSRINGRASLASRSVRSVREGWSRRCGRGAPHDNDSHAWPSARARLHPCSSPAGGGEHDTAVPPRPPSAGVRLDAPIGRDGWDMHRRPSAVALSV